MTGKWLRAMVLSLGLVLPGRGADPGEGSGAIPLRFAFSAQMFTDVNENDAKASVKAWGMAIARERGIPIEAYPIILSGVGELREALAQQRIEGASVGAEEFLALDPSLQPAEVFYSVFQERISEEYQVLVRADAAAADLRALSRKSLVVFENARASVAALWLEVALAEQGLEPSSRHFARTTRAGKLSKVVLPVFFRQADACLVTRRGFDAMCELNPQVRNQLRVVARSPEVVPIVGFFRAGYDSPVRLDLLEAMKSLQRSPAGTQVLTLFQSEKLVEAPTTCLDSVRQLLATHRRLIAGGATNATARHPAP